MRYLATFLALLLSFNVSAQDNVSAPDKVAAPNYMAKYIEGVDYQLLSPAVRTISKGKIEVTEAFSYVCGHCYNIEATLKKWQKTLADDVALVKLPVVFKASMEHYARIYYTGKALKISEQVTDAAFRAIHIQNNRLKSKKSVLALFASLGISAEKFNEKVSSFGVDKQVREASARTRAMKITGTPQMIVDGRFSVSVTREGGHEGMLKVVDYLVQEIRAKRK